MMTEREIGKAQGGVNGCTEVAALVDGRTPGAGQAAQKKTCETQMIVNSKPDTNPARKKAGCTSAETEYVNGEGEKLVIHDIYNNKTHKTVLPTHPRDYKKQ